MTWLPEFLDKWFLDDRSIVYEALGQVSSKSASVKKNQKFPICVRTPPPLIFVGSDSKVVPYVLRHLDLLQVWGSVWNDLLLLHNYCVTISECLKVTFVWVKAKKFV